MKILDIVKVVGGGVLNAVLPGAGTAVVSVVNEFLPEEEKLPVNATGYQVENAINSLPPESRSIVLEKQFEVDITQIREAHSTLRAMLEAEQNSTHTTRPKIAYGSFLVVATGCLIADSMWAYSIATGPKEEMFEALTGSWQFIATVNWPLVAMLWAYFGILKQEQKNKLTAAAGSNTGGLLPAIINMIRK